MINIDNKTKICCDVALKKHAFDILLLDIREHSSISDYFLICSASSTTQVRAIVDEIVELLKKNKIKSGNVEGYNNARWVIIDLNDIIVHIFHEETRKYYNLEKLWDFAVTTKIE